MILAAQDFSAARYPLVLEDDTILCDEDFIRYVRRKCGGEIADIVAELVHAENSKEDTLRALDVISEAILELEEVKTAIEAARDNVERMVQGNAQ